MADWVSLSEATEKSVYSHEHIALLVRSGKVAGRKSGKIWLVDLDSLKEYQAKMQDLGDKKYSPVRNDLT
jgi:hypothetical protein